MARLRICPIWPSLVAILLIGYSFAEEDSPLRGRFITINGAIDSGLKNRVIQAMRSAARDDAKVIVFDLKISTQSDFGTCYDLAKTIGETGKLRTVAFVSQPLYGHGILVALACDEIVMTDDAQIGDVYRERPGGGSEIEKNAYLEISQSKGHGKWLPLAMVDKDLRLLEVQTPNGSQFVPEDRLEEFGPPVLRKQVVKESGDRLVLDAPSAKKYSLISRTATDRREVALIYGLPESAAAEDFLDTQSLDPVLLKLQGNIDNRLYEYVRRKLNRAGHQGYDLIFVQIESSDGDTTAASNIAEVLASSPARKVAWVPRKATGPATFILFGCNELIIAPEATIGKFEISETSPEEYRELANNAVRLASESQFPEALVRGLIDPQSEVFKIQSHENPGQSVYMTAEEWEALEKAKQAEWGNHHPIKNAGVVLELTGEAARNYDLASGMASDWEEVKAIYDIPGKVHVLQHGWIDKLVEGLTSTGGTVFLLVLAMTCLYIEMQVPGFGVAGLLSALCFSLFFWSRVLSDTANSLEIMLFMLGLAFLAVELFVLPGFGFAGILGIGLVLTSLILASQSFHWPSTEAERRFMFTNVLTLGASLVVFLATAVALARYFHQIPFVSRLMLSPPSEEESSSLLEAPIEKGPTMFQQLLGQRGTAASPLRPAGRIQLGERFYDVVTRGEFIEPGTTVEIVEVHENRIIVRDVRVES